MLRQHQGVVKICNQPQPLYDLSMDCWWVAVLCFSAIFVVLPMCSPSFSGTGSLKLFASYLFVCELNRIMKNVM